MAVMTNGIAGRVGTDPQGPDTITTTPQRIAGTAPPPKLEQPAVKQPPRTVGPTAGPGSELTPAIAAARTHREELLRKPHVIDIRAGYKFKNGQITDTPAVVVLVDRKVDISKLPSQDRIPFVVGNVPTDVAPADPIERLRGSARTQEAAALVPKQPRLLIDELQDVSEAAFVEEALPVTTYTPPPNGDLSAVTGPMSVTCHVSPDAGWKVLQPFLSETQKQICLGMYDFTAPHIYKTVRTLLKNEDVSWTQTLGPKESLPTEDDVDSTKANDLTEAQVTRGLRRVAGDRFENAFAHVGSGKTFASAYHIKVAVQDRKKFWLSSGNWQSSNQPDIDFFDASADVSEISRFNREWHVVVDNAALSKTFQIFLEHDFRTAKAPVEEAALLAGPDLLIPVEEFLREEAAQDLEVFAPRTFVFTQANPLTVQPILTPDNYAEIVLKLLRKRPTTSLYFQNQSLNPVKDPTPEFKELMQLLADYSNDPNLDVRLIFRNIGPVRKKLESLQAAGFNMQRVKMQSGCHTKGIVIDSRTLLLGSHNFTNQGVQVNRDASLLIKNEGIAKYYERVFLHDWDRLSRPTVREEAVPIPVNAAGLSGGAESAALAAGMPPGDYVRVPWSYLQED